MKLGLTGKNAVITGGSAGIGLACAKALAAEGANVVIISRNQEKLDKAVAILKNIAPDRSIFSICEDLTDCGAPKRSVEEAISKLGNIDILINNAGSARAGIFWDLEGQDFIQAWNLKFLGYVEMVRETAIHMKPQRRGRIVNIIGTGGRTPSPTFLPGGTVNAALLNFTKGISRDLAAYGIRINAISPGITATERAEMLAQQNAEANGITIEEQKKEDNAGIPLGQMVQPEEIATMALILASDIIPSMTGTEIVIDGGKQPGL
ncbi:SDR family oxidoreductase [Ammoniphilus sp. CFH 90114]|uniref:SDR family oxidoreductase n=1 Tax=Ammoniphilus sp. CFH 90114 TaxID=2493665 RepID=UPI00100FCC9A|nr:SDR family oxidoreductase [Ammoniphilus sp. CFH 90114]RXT07250.1 SDR family oxidoreductase [Ammoniphilus sp. CFH 90114]